VQSAIHLAARVLLPNAVMDITPADDSIVSLLTEQHRDIRSLLDSVLATHRQHRAELLDLLRCTLALHEITEAEAVHPIARKALASGDLVVKARLREEGEAKQALVELQALDVDSPEFEAKFHALRISLLEHAEAEEKEEFNVLAATLEPARLERMRIVAAEVESRAMNELGCTLA
jgi:hypothetical protein